MEEIKTPPTAAKLYKILPLIIFLFLLFAFFNAVSKVIYYDFTGIFLFISFLIVTIYAFYLLSTVFSFSYKIGEDSVIIRKHFPTTETYEIPFKELDRVFFYHSPLEEKLNIVNVKLFWRDGNKINSFLLHGIEANDAFKIFEAYTKFREKSKESEEKKVFTLEELSQFFLALQNKLIDFVAEARERMSKQEERMSAVEEGLENIERRGKQSMNEIEEFKKDVITSEISLSDRIEKLEAIVENLTKELEELKKTKEEKEEKKAKAKKTKTKKTGKEEKGKKEKSKKGEKRKSVSKSKKAKKK